jgi:hypothetical protein
MKIEAVFEDIFEEVIPLITGPQNAAHAAVSRELFLGLANDVHAHAPHHRKVFGGVFCADTAGVFPEGDIEKKQDTHKIDLPPVAPSVEVLGNLNQVTQ